MKLYILLLLLAIDIIAAQNANTTTTTPSTTTKPTTTPTTTPTTIPSTTTKPTTTPTTRLTTTPTTTPSTTTKPTTTPTTRLTTTPTTITTPTTKPTTAPTTTTKPTTTPTTTTKPTTTSAQPTTTSAQPTTTSAQPTTTSAKPTTTSAQPTTTSAKPTTTSAKPTTTSAKPTTTSAKPTTTSAKPTTTSAKPTTTSAKPTTTSAKPTTTSAKSTTTAQQTTSSSENTTESSSPSSSRASTASPSTAAPTTQQPSVKQDFTCKEQNTTKFALTGVFTLFITYNKTNEGLVTVPIAVPHTNNSNGTCGNSSAETLTFDFYSGWSITYIFQGEGISEDGLLSASDKYYISNITVVYVHDEHLPGSTEANRTFVSQFAKPGYLEATSDGYYTCQANISQKIDDSVTLSTTDFKYKAFNGKGDINLNSGTVAECSSDEEISSTVPIVVAVALAGLAITVFIVYQLWQRRKLNKNRTVTFTNVTECSADEDETSSIVPIAVGAALAGLVLIVLIAYLIGRKRSKKTGYETV